jgi:perosamine synthetase
MIPVSEPLLTDRELESVGACIKTGWISSTGPMVEKFEEQWSQYCGRKYGVSVCNGTAALQAAVAALHLAEGDEVILPTFTIISCATAILYAGGKPVLVDVDPRTWTMDVAQVADKITSHTKAIMVVHIYGHPVDLDPIIALAERHGLAIIEDAAEAHGAEYLSQRTGPAPKWKRCGSFGRMSCFSFYANKLITTGEGGMVLTATCVFGRNGDFPTRSWASISDSPTCRRHWGSRSSSASIKSSPKNDGSVRNIRSTCMEYPNCSFP